MPGTRRAIAPFLSAVLGLGCASAFAADPVAKPPLQLRLASTSAPTSLTPAPTTLTRTAPGSGPRAARFRVAQPSLGERALSSLLDDAHDRAQADGPADGATFRFNRRGHAGRDIAQGYNNMCEAVSRKVWDDPKGKRVKFDVAGKPGVGIEIPLR